jgi:hypothetical protein
MTVVSSISVLYKTVLYVREYTSCLVLEVLPASASPFWFGAADLWDANNPRTFKLQARRCQKPATDTVMYRTTGKYSNPASFPQDVCLNFR